MEAQTRLMTREVKDEVRRVIRLIPGLGQRKVLAVPVPPIGSWNWFCPASGCTRKNYYRTNQCQRCGRVRFKVEVKRGPRGGKLYAWYMQVDWGDLPTKQASEYFLFSK